MARNENFYLAPDGKPFLDSINMTFGPSSRSGRRS